MQAEFKRLADEFESLEVPGALSTTMYQMDANANAFILAVVFEDKQTYFANANDPAQHERYLRMRALLSEDPVWHDGQIVFSYQY